MYPFKPFCISAQAVFFVWNSDLHLISCSSNDLYVVSSSWEMEVSGATNIMMREPTTLGSCRDLLKSIWLTFAVNDQRNLCFLIHVFRALSAVQYWLAAPLQYRNTQSCHSNQASTNAVCSVNVCTCLLKNKCCWLYLRNAPSQVSSNLGPFPNYVSYRRHFPSLRFLSFLLPIFNW